MTKRKREEESDELPSYALVLEELATPVAQSVGDQEELGPVGQATHEDRSWYTVENAEADTSAAKEGEFGPFWALLAHAGYTVWGVGPLE